MAAVVQAAPWLLTREASTASGVGMAIVIVYTLSVAQAAISNDLFDPTVVARAQRYEHQGIATLVDRSLDSLYRMCVALVGDAEEAESIIAQTLQKALDGLSTFDGDGAAFHVWLLRMAAASAARRRRSDGGSSPSEQGAGIRAGLARISHFDYQLLALRILGQIDVDHLAPALNAEPATLRAWTVTALREVDGRSGTGWGHDLRAFDEAVSTVLQGAEPEQAASKTSAPADAERLLQQVAQIRDLDGDPIPPEVATRLRTNSLAAAAERRAQWVYRHHGVATVPGIEGKRYSSRTGTFLALSIAAALAVVVGAVVAVLASFANPASALYPLKLAGESALVDITVSKVDKASLEVKLAQTRAREAEDMAARGNGDLAVEVTGSRFKLLRAAASDLEAVRVHDSRWRAARDRLFKESDASLIGIHQELLATGQTRSAADVDALTASYEKDRKRFQEVLAPAKPQQPEAPPAEPAPSPTAS